MQLKNHTTGDVIATVTGSLAAQIAVNAPLTATYDVLVRDSNISRPGTALGSYTVTLAKIPAALVVHAGDQGGAMTNGANHTGSIYVGDLDAWTFTAALGDYITLAVGEVPPGEIDPNFVPWIRLIGPTGTVILSAQGALAAQIATAAPLSGTYTVLVSDSAISREPSHTADYVLTMVKTNAALTVPNGDEGGPMTNGANHEVIEAEDIAVLKANVLASGLSISQLVSTAWASASTFRGTDKRGGANGARIRLAPQKDWEVNNPAELAKVLKTLEEIQKAFNDSQPGGSRKVSLADVIVLAGCAAVEQAAKKAGYDVQVPFTPGRTDASQEQTDVEAFAVLEPAADGFRNYLGHGGDVPAEYLLIERARMDGIVLH